MKNIKIVTLLCSLLFVENFYADNNDFTEQNNDDNLHGGISVWYTIHAGDKDYYTGLVDDEWVSRIEELSSLGCTDEEESIRSVKNLVQIMPKLKGYEMKICIPNTKLSFIVPEELRGYLEELSYYCESSQAPEPSSWLDYLKNYFLSWFK